MDKIFEKGVNFIWENARLLERAIFEYYFLGGSPERIRSILRLYQNMDGGFGHALEPDLRSPDSHPLFVEFALETLYDCNIHDPEIAHRACDFLAEHSDFSQGIPMVFPSAQKYPGADHMKHESSWQPSIDRLVGLVGLVNWQDVDHPWLPGAVEACLQHILTSHFDDAHTLRTSFHLVESMACKMPVDQYFDKLSRELMVADFFIPDAPVKTYGLTPLEFAPAPDSFCRRIFSDAQVNGHLDDLLAHQQEDGGWPISWNPPSEMARLEWRAQRTVSALHTLRAYGRI